MSDEATDQEGAAALASALGEAERQCNLADGSSLCLAERCDRILKAAPEHKLAMYEYRVVHFISRTLAARQASQQAADGCDLLVQGV